MFIWYCLDIWGKKIEKKIFSVFKCIVKVEMLFFGKIFYIVVYYSWQEKKCCFVVFLGVGVFIFIVMFLLQMVIVKYLFMR